MRRLNEEYQLFTTLNRSSSMQRVLLIISDSEFPLSSKMIAEKIGLWQSNVIRILDELSKMGAINEVTNVKRGRMYVLTEEGKSAIKIIEKLRSSS